MEDTATRNTPPGLKETHPYPDPMDRKHKKGSYISITPDELPVLDSTKKVNLRKMVTENGKVYYLGGCVVKGSKFFDLTNKLQQDEKNELSKSFYRAVCGYLENRTSSTDLMTMFNDSSNDRNIKYVHSGKNRGYYLHRIVNGVDMFVNIVNCRKTKQGIVLKTFTGKHFKVK